jgi:fructuronate reductase
MDEWWDEASRHLTLPAAEISAYRSALLERFTNPRIQHLLRQIAMDGSQKLPFRVLPVVAAERAAGRLPVGGIRALAGWLLHLRAGEDVRDPRAAELTAIAAGPDSARRIVAAVDEKLAADDELIAALTEQERALSAGS